MLDHGLAHLKFRERAETLEVCATSGVNISVTKYTYVRASGSWITEGYQPGHEIQPAGFTNALNNERAIVLQVEALTLTVREERIIEAAASGRTITVGLPEDLADENVEFDPNASFPYLKEDYVRGPQQMVSAPYNGGVMEERGIYALNWHFLPGFDSFVIHACVDALLALFSPGSVIGSGANAVMVTGDPGPSATQPEPDGEGWTVVSIDIPWLALTTNAVEA